MTSNHGRLGPADLKNKTIDVHTHIGVSPAAYLSGAYPYCQSVESLLYRMDHNGVDAAIAFPLGEGVFFDARRYIAESRRVPAQPRLTPAPFVRENRLLCEEVYEKPLATPGRVLPFASVDPGRFIKHQMTALERLTDEYPIYGLKCSGIMVQSSHRHFLKKAECFVRFAEERNLPMLLHSTAHAGDKYSHNLINLDVAHAFPAVRFCLAHCLGFDKARLDEADAMPNVWVDSAAMKIQVEIPEIHPPAEQRFPSEYPNFRRVFRDLVEAYPTTMIWGSDSPYYTFYEKRRYADGSVVDFVYHATYEQEREALDALDAKGRRQAANANTLRFLFGD